MSADHSSTTQIRAAADADHATCAALIGGQPLFGPYGLTPEGLQKSLQAAGAGQQILLAEDDSGILGFVWFMTRGAFGRSGYLRLLVTASAAQGRGVGNLLMTAVEAAVFSEVDDLFLLVNTGNSGAQRFYERRGFERAGEIGSYVAPGLDEILLRKSRAARFADSGDD